jgi:hypothetical protein
MPWKPSEAKGHTKKAKTPAEQRQWSHVANKILASTGNDASAIRQANAVVAKHPSRKKR